MNSESDEPVQYLSAADLVRINEEVTGGASAVRDLHLLDSALLRPSLVLFGEVQFPGLLDKAAAMFHSVAYHHLFYDGNKRTAVRAVKVFLDRNGWMLRYDPALDYDFVLETAQGRHDIPDIRAWLAARTERIEPGTGSL